MSRPRACASQVREIAPGVLHWTVHDDRIDFRSDAYAVDGPDGRVLIDPLPVSGPARRSLGRVRAICLTAPSHQRAAWELRAALRVPVWAPDGAWGLDRAPDRTFGRVAALPGRLAAIDAPGPIGPHRAFARRLADGRLAVFAGDLTMRAGEEAFRILPDGHLADAGAARRTIARLVALGPDLWLAAHGAPLLRDAGRALARVAGNG